MRRNPTRASLLGLLVAAPLLLPGCPLKDDFSLETDDVGGAHASGGARASGGAEHGGTSGSGAGGNTAGGASNSGGGSGGSDTGTSGCVSVSNQGHAYYFCFSALVQARARANCGTQGMTLAVIEDQAENDWIAKTWSEQYKGDSTSAYIGANDVTTEGEWHWADGTAFWRGGAAGEAVSGRYTNWDSGQPNNSNPVSGAAENCLTMNLPSGTWNDQTCDTELPYVCEPR